MTPRTAPARQSAGDVPPARVLLAVPDGAAALRFGALAHEAVTCAVVDVIASPPRVLDRLSTSEVDVVVLHEGLGSPGAPAAGEAQPPLDLAREINRRHPSVGVVLAAAAHDAGLLRGALQSGVRNVISAEPSLEELAGAIDATSAWAQQMQARLGDDVVAAGGDRAAGALLVLAGAKGGVGATTLAIQLALEARRDQPSRSVCLVDLDLQTGDMRALMDLTYHRSIADLVDVADEVSARHLDESLCVHASGVRVLLPPRDGEQAEDITGQTARLVLGAIRSRFDVVVVDVGAVMTEAGAVAVELADHVLVVATPDVPALRGANRLLGLWERLAVRAGGVAVVLNRASRNTEVQADLVAKVVGAHLLHATVPAAYRALEGPTNTGVPERLGDGPVRRALSGLAEELGLAPRQARRRRFGLGGQSGQAGQVAVETAGLILTIGLTILLAWEVALVGLTFAYASHAAREGARELAVGGDVTAAASAGLPGSWREGLRVAPGGSEVTATLTVPALVPGARSPFTVTTSAGTVVEEAPVGTVQP